MDDGGRPVRFREDEHDAWFGNVKRTYDSYQDLDLERARSEHEMRLRHAEDQHAQNQRHADAEFNQRLTLAAEAAAIRQARLANTNEESKAEGSQRIRHADLSFPKAIDEVWNMDVEEGAGNALLVEAFNSGLILGQRAAGAGASDAGE